MFTNWKFSFEISSFILGFFSASLFWWIFLRSKKHFPRIKTYFVHQVQQIRERNRAGISAVIRQATLRKVEKMHLSSSLFALEEIIVPPQLIVAPAHINPYISNYPDITSYSVIPYLPDWPELSAQYPVPKISLPQAIENHTNIVIFGQPGTGKTVSLAYLAIKLCRQDIEVIAVDNLVPIHAHIHDFKLDDGSDPLSILHKAVSPQFSMFVSSRLTKYLRSISTEGKLLLLLDGLDEICDDGFTKAVDYIGVLQKAYPKILIVTTADPFRMGDLINLNFIPYALASWNFEQKNEFMFRWKILWEGHIIPEISKRMDYHPIDLDLINYWLMDNLLYITPLELTLRLWAAYTGDMLGFASITSVEAYVRRTSRDIIPRGALEGLAYEFVRQNQSSIGFGGLESFLSRFIVMQDGDQNDLQNPSEESSRDDKQNIRKGKKGKKLSRSAYIIERLLDTGILQEYSGEQISFVHPIIMGYLAGFVANEFVDHPPAPITWPSLVMFYKFAAARGKLDNWINYALKNDVYPLYHNLFTFARWLGDAPQNVSWRSQLLQYMISLLKDENLPYGIHARLLTAFIVTNDASIPIMLKQLLPSTSTNLRLLAVIGIGAVGDQKFIKDLLNLYSDSEESIRTAACLAIGAMNTKQSFNVMEETLKQADENLRFAAAETLVASSAGQDLLKEAVTFEDLLTRRAAVYGISKIRTDWAKILLEKIAIGDGQWIIRSAAGQGLDFLKGDNPFTPQIIPSTSSSPWLITYASKQGIGISPDDPAIEILLSALKSGSPDDKVNSLSYLRLHLEKEVTLSIYQSILNEKNPVQDAGLYALFLIRGCGANLESQLS